MRFSEILAASILATVTTAHGSGIPGAPKIVGNAASDIVALRARNILGSRRVTHQPHNAKVQARQGGDVNGRCGKDFGCATCAEGYCCSSGGWCGQGSDYCQAPDSQFEYGPAADANTVPPSGSTLNTARTKVGSVAYGGDGIYVCTTPGKIAITYDDGPYSYTGKVLDLFLSYNFKATFFITGINLSKGRIDDASQPWSALISRMLSEGHQIASHTWSHQDLSAITKAQRYDQMVRLEMALTNIIGKFPTYMRPPYSSCSTASGCPADMADLGYHISYFDLDTDDYNNITPELQQNAKNNFYNAVNPSNSATDDFLGIAHDIHYQTAYNLTGYMLDLMVKKGYTGVTMGECLGDPEANWYRTPSARVASTSSFSQPACASTASSFSRSASATSSGVVATPTAVSQDSSCGAAAGLTCLGFSGGECCSQYNYCGSTEGHCGTGCQVGFGKCGVSSSSSSSAAASSKAASSSTGASSTLVSSTRVSSSASASATPSRVISTDGSCSGNNAYTCVGSTFGDCCSQYGWCGTTDGHCGTGCNPLFGKCPSSTSSTSSVAASSAVSSSTSKSSSVRSSSSSAVQSSSSRPASSSSSSSRAASSSASSSKPASSSTIPTTKAASSSPVSSSKAASLSPTSSTKPSSSSSISSSKAASSSPSSSSPVSSSKPASSSPASSSKPASTSTKPASSSGAPSSTRSSSASPSATVKVSTDGSCGGTKGFSCIGYYEGECCSQYGYCGKTTTYCGTGCNKSFGKCT